MVINLFKNSYIEEWNKNKKKLLLEAFFFNIINFYDIFSKNWRTFSKKIKHKGI